MIGCLAWLLSVVCLGRSFMSFDLGGVTFSIDRVVLVVLVAVYFVRRSLGDLDRKPLCSADYLLFGLIAWLTFSTFTHGFNREFFDTTSSPVWNLMAGYWMPLTAYWIVRQSKLNEQSLSQLYRFLLVLGLYLVLTGIFEIGKQWWLVFPRYIADPDVGIHFGRARGPFGNSIRYGVYVAICFLAAWMCWLRLSRRQQMLSLPLAPLFLAAIFFSYTRSIWLGVAAGMLAVAVMTLQGRTRTALLASVAVAGLLASCLLWQKLVFLEREESGAYAAVSVTNRASHAYVSWKMFQDRPLLGFGFGQYPNEKLTYLYDRNTELKLQRLRTRLSHNTVLTLMVEVGAMGLGLFMAVMAAWVCRAVSIWRNPNAPLWARRHAILFMAALCVYFFQLLFHEVTFRPDINALIFMLAGTVVGLSERQAVHEQSWLEVQSVYATLQPAYS